MPQRVALRDEALSIADSKKNTIQRSIVKGVFFKPLD